MQQQQYESFSSESEIAPGRQGVGGIWSDGEKLRPEPKRKQRMGGFSPLATIVIVIVVLFVVCVLVVLVGILVALLAVHSVQTVPVPIHP